MKKLRLNVEQLVVDSFRVSDRDGKRGTVNAHDSGPTNHFGYITCLGYCGESVEWACETTNNPILDCLCTGDC